MPIIAREYDGSEKRILVTSEFSNLAAGTYGVEIVPGPYQIDAVRVAATGLTSAPTVQIAARRFISGVGATTINIGATLLTITAWGTSGVQSYLLPATGSSLLQLAENDVLSVITASGGVTEMSVSFVLRTLQDIKSYYSVAL